MFWSATLISAFGQSDYCLFLGLKQQMNISHFLSDVKVIAAAETWLDGQFYELFLSALEKLEQRANWCIELRRNYVEEIHSL